MADKISTKVRVEEQEGMEPTKAEAGGGGRGGGSERSKKAVSKVR
jgi:hypothetical protein